MLHTHTHINMVSKRERGRKKWLTMKGSKDTHDDAKKNINHKRISFPVSKNG